ncbi:hypothetical protein [[Clostridium] aminophilum]|uniref:hypothetical protein n=1 Tax=[Clostridium] aminophilum TaxID=1526 RepID=UPI0033173D2D
MKKCRLVFNGELQDEVFDSIDDALDYGLYLQGCERLGMEELSLSNPGDYPFDEDDYEASDYYAFEED